MPAQMPTLPDKVDGIVGLDPVVLQCRDCGVTASNPRYSDAVVILTAGYRFHLCEGRDGIRRCPDCLSRALAECTVRDHRGDSGTVLGRRGSGKSGLSYDHPKEQ